MEFKNYHKSYYESWFNMLSELFKDSSADEIRKSLDQTIQSEKEEVFFAVENESPVGFITVSLRTEYVEGCTSSPVGYIESVFVQAAFRKGGVAKKLFSLAEAWAKKQGCRELGSDTWVWNKDAVAFHLKLGFKEEDTLVHFIKDIP
ncbi:aminoglycoside 6'-N-acetyltransferase [Poritiphilus flavus]|uniref:GNAT family N-acetyltransferase n=1 Tax=Poritiphilus flavus TaxID=2697053 RepID=A0A6L9E7N8_9FLAO|nr:aminoglycoside 6'-N-acetyltransferase [Poritiphilus flavus]NAS10710.1 GNAT family N-acetyltransferase [Poritiphilus flavus]